LQVIVDTETTGKKLLKNGKLKKRVTIIPLNQISNRSIDAKVIEAAEKIVGANNAVLALSLVGYDAELQAAMNFVFGNTFICPGKRYFSYRPNPAT
jgi:structural maintenance of chromosome 2